MPQEKNIQIKMKAFGKKRPECQGRQPVSEYPATEENL